MAETPPQVPKPAKQPCGKCQKKDWNRPSAAARGYDADHVRQKRLVMAEQKGLCGTPGCKAWARELHHIDNNPHNHARENVIAYCSQCHLVETIKQRRNRGATN